MKRRHFIAGSAIAAATACTTKDKSLTKSTHKTTFKWRCVLVVPKTLPIWGPGVIKFAENVKKISQGALDIQVYGAGELVPALGTFDAVKAGQVEMGHSAAYYWQGKLPASAFFTSVPFGMNANGMQSWIANGGGQELWDELYAPHGVKSIQAGNTGVQMGGWFKKEIKSINDYRGLKMRIPGLGGKVIAKVGGKPMLVAGGEIYTNLSTGVIDATEWVGPYHDYIMGFYKAAKYYYTPGWHEPGPVLELMMNKKAWDGLPEDLQQVVQTCAAETDRNIYSEWITKDAEYYQKILNETKTEIRTFPTAVLSELRKISTAVKQEVAETSPLAARIYKSHESFQASFEAHQKVTEHAYVKAQNS